MASLTTLREALAANLNGITGLQNSAYMLSSPTPPCAEVMPGLIDYDQTFRRGLDKWNFIVRAFVGAVSDKGSQKRLDGFLASTGAQSIKTALESNPTLSGAAEIVHVARCSGYRIYERAGAGPLLGAEWEVQVWVVGT